MVLVDDTGVLDVQPAEDLGRMIRGLTVARAAGPPVGAERTQGLEVLLSLLCELLISGGRHDSDGTSSTPNDVGTLGDWQGLGMYSADLTKISIDRFDETLRTIELLPSRRVLQDHISTVTSRLKERGIEDLGALRRLLADKQRYTPLGEELGVDAEYLVLLNREVNAYRSKPLPLSKLDVFSDAELDGLAEVGIRSTKHLYERAALPAQRTALVAELKLDGEHMVAALQLSNCCASMA